MVKVKREKKERRERMLKVRGTENVFCSWKNKWNSNIETATRTLI